MPTFSTPITLAYGDGTGPELMEAALTVLREAGAQLTVETIEIGSRIYKRGSKTGILPSALDTLRRTGLLFKGPVIVPEKEGYEDVGIVIRREMGLEESKRDFFYDPVSDTQTATAYIGDYFAMFESLQPDNSSATMHASILLLKHIGQYETATRIHNAWLKAMEDGFGRKKRRRAQKLAEAVVERLGQLPKTVQPVEYKPEPEEALATSHPDIIGV